jgi:hypothetical protein
MANEQNIIPHQFKKGEVANPNGRPKKFVSAVLTQLKEAGYDNIKRSQIVDVYETLLVLPKEELVSIGQDDSQPMIFRIIAKAMLSNKGFEIIERMIERTQGKPKQTTDVNMDGAINVALVEFINEKPNADNQTQDTNTT